jgi:hypothetical protein
VTHAADHGEDSGLPSRDPTREGKEEEREADQVVVLTDTTSKSSDVETIDVEEDEGDVQSPRATAVLPPGRRAAEAPRPAPGAQGLSTSSTSPADDVGSNKRLKKAPPKPCKPGLRSATK